MTDEPNIIRNPIYEWTLREDGVITIYITDSESRETRVLIGSRSELVGLKNVVDLAECALEIYEADGFDAANETIQNYIAENSLTATEDDFNRLLDDDDS